MAIKTGPWTAEEDAILTRLVVEEGLTKWSDIAKQIPGRLSKRVRERWTCQLHPMRRAKEVAPWTSEEIDRLFAAKCVAGSWGMGWMDGWMDPSHSTTQALATRRHAKHTRNKQGAAGEQVGGDREAPPRAHGERRQEPRLLRDAQAEAQGCVSVAS